MEVPSTILTKLGFVLPFAHTALPADPNEISKITFARFESDGARWWVYPHHEGEHIALEVLVHPDRPIARIRHRIGKSEFVKEFEYTQYKYRACERLMKEYVDGVLRVGNE